MSDTLLVCGVPDYVGRGQLCRWPRKQGEEAVELRWSVTGAGFSDPHVEVFQKVWENWEKVCGIKPILWTNARTANVLHDTRVIDRQGGILAEAYLPCSPNPSQLMQFYDRLDTFNLGKPPYPSGHVGLEEVATHETGHSLGLSHAPDSVKALMNAFYVPGLYLPQAWDIQQAQARYGPPVFVPEPPIVPPTIPPIGGTVMSEIAKFFLNFVVIPWLEKRAPQTPEIWDDLLLKILKGFGTQASKGDSTALAKAEQAVQILES